MAPVLFLDDVQRKKAALWALIWNLVFLHVWFSIMVWAVVTKKPADYDNKTMQIMIGAVIGSMGINVLLLISNDALNIVFALLSKWLGIVPLPARAGTIEETTTKKTVVTPTSIDGAVNDVNIKAEGNVNVASQ